jgi:hypothetical protein
MISRDSYLREMNALQTILQYRVKLNERSSNHLTIPCEIKWTLFKPSYNTVW